MIRFFVLLAMVLAGTAADAQPLAAPMTPQQHLATQWAQQAGQVLSGEQLPRADQYTRAAILLDQALQQDPADADLWRQRAELAAVQGDADRRLDSLRQVVRLDPQDDAAQLDLILTMVDTAQTVDARLTQLTALLGSQRGQALGDPLRSRLATVAAGAAQELGQPETFAKWLAVAVQLDPTNAEAAALLYDLALQRGANTLQLGTAAAAWVRAAPFNPAPRAALMNALLDEAVYHEAAQQFDLAVSLQNQPPTEAIIHDWALTLAAANRPQEAVDVIDQYDRMQRRAATSAAYQAAAEAGQQEPPAVEPPPLPASLNLLTLAIHQSTEHLRGSDEQDRAYRVLMRQLGEQAEAGNVEATQDMLWVPAVFGYDLDALANRLAGIESDSPLVQRAQGWLALQQGATDRAEMILNRLADRDPFAALGLARLEADGTNVQARRLQDVIQRWPRSVPGLMAARQLHTTRAAVEPTETGSLLRRVLNRYPNRIWRAESRLLPWTSFTARTSLDTAGYLEPIPVTVQLENVSGVPLALGRGGTLPTAVMLQVQASAGGRSMGLPPMFVDLGRKLRLETGGVAEVTARLDRALLGQVLQSLPTPPVTLQVQAILDPQMTRTGGMAPGPLGGRGTTSPIRRSGQPLRDQALQDWIADLGAIDRVSQMTALSALLQLLDPPMDPNDPLRPTLAPEQREQVVTAISSAYGDFDVPMQAWTVLMTPPSEPAREALRPVLDRARRSDATPVRLAYLARHVTAADDPVLLASLRGGTAEVRQFAEAVQAAIAAEQQAAQTADDPGADAMK